jgi:hypothetical protein
MLASTSGSEPIARELQEPRDEVLRPNCYVGDVKVDGDRQVEGLVDTPCIFDGLADLQYLFLREEM